MLKIILGDDDKFLLQLEREKLDQQIARLQIQAKIVFVSTSDTEILQYVQNNQEPYLCFLDLDFGRGKLNGIDIARQMKQLIPECKIVFVTNHEEMAIQVLKSGVEPFGFIEKTTEMNAMSQGYRKYLQIASKMLLSEETAGSAEEEITIQLGFDETMKMKKHAIMYVETEKSISHGITYHTVDGSNITVRDSLQLVQEKLGDSFIKIHRAVLVNKDAIIGMQGTDIILSDGSTLPCSIRLKNSIKEMVNNKYSQG